jgi:hypothetical protein
VKTGADGEIKEQTGAKFYSTAPGVGAAPLQE